MSYRNRARALAVAMTVAGLLNAAAAAQNLPAVRSLSDTAGERIYLLRPDGVDVVDARTRRAVTRVVLPGWTWAGEPYSCLPDIAFAPEGDVLVTSNVLPVVWRIQRHSLAVREHRLAVEQDAGRDVGFTRLRWSANEGAYVATTDLGELWEIDRQLTRARKLSGIQPSAQRLACEG